MDIKSLIRDIPDFPKPGILFRDITTLLRDPQGLKATVEQLTAHCEAAGLKPDLVLGMESRGFIFGPTLAYQLGAGFIPVRKPGKLPAAIYSAEYALEYGTDRLEMHQDAIASGQTVLIVDDLIATGGTAQAAAQLVQQGGGTLIGYAFIVELLFLNGRDKLGDAPILSLVQY
ncbi:adenine phosphoribosyltransferase [Spirulina major CS-329]|uniref:adenine phosphoribosyltransferase n=1 Tax=Spirulina TaxID=1154 RepID=UPI00232FCB5D|nr:MULTISPECIES: adenine phosphoribosyltransferase [Spirulina]MDB9495803.1 adenine phosphoribosyltransferase [Spirulina subsalsa CS-330]MDB9503759.1 adenine phosphoribosyltransferase [Spirulina major CS-329]